jgi:beta-mannanase
LWCLKSKKIGDAGYPVLFRPLHESNNNYMWWAKKGSGAYKQLWKLIYDRAQAIGAHNILWVFNGMADKQSTKLSEWYPGDNMVDVVSSDYFQSWNDYNTCKAIGNNKILAVAETMNQINPDKDAPWNFSVVWASRDWNGNSENDWKTAMKNSKTITIDQLPSFKSGSGPVTSTTAPVATTKPTETAKADTPQAVTGKNADPKATKQAINLLEYLRTHTYISGQTDVPDAEKIKNLTGRYPAIVAFDFYNATNGEDNATPAINWAKKTGGIIAFQWHWRAPQGGNYDSNYDFANDMNNKNSKLYQDIDTVLKQLKKIGDAGYPVLWRPLHEANNNYMWWAKKGSDNYKKLWKIIYDRAQELDVHNLIWVFNGMASQQSTEMSQWYPGDNMVDVVSSDYFQSSDDYKKCKAIGKDKVVAIAETMNQINPDKDAPWSFSVVWASRDWKSNSESDWKTAMGNSKTISIDQLPDFNKDVVMVSPTPTKVPEAWEINIAKGKTVKSSSNEATDKTPENAVDGDETSRWASGATDTESIEVDLGKASNIDRVVLKWEDAYGTAYKIQVSKDGTTWDDVFSTTTGKGGTEEVKFTAKEARYVKMLGEKRATKYGFSLYEIEVYESKTKVEPTPTPTTVVATPTPTKKVDATATPVVERVADVNDDKKVDSSDMAMMKKFILKKLTKLTVETMAADLDGDGEISTIDYVLLKKLILGKIDQIPANAK